MAEAADYGLPVTTPESREAARRQAVAARQIRADFKNKVHAGEYTLDGALEEGCTNKTLQRLYVRDFLKCFPGIGKAKANDAMVYSHIAYSRRMSGLTASQRARLREWFAMRARR